MSRKPSLFLVPTPVGNLEDMTLRAIRILKEVDFILSEDTRKTGILLNHFGIRNRLISHHQFNEHKALVSIVERLRSGEVAALVSDAGTPGISDPGFLLVRECLRENLEVETLPGPTAFIPALVNSGIPCDSFLFVGFLPHKKGRQSKLKELSVLPYTLVFYESPHRLSKLIAQLIEHVGPDRQASVSRELTKLFEDTVRGSLQQLADHFSGREVKGEVVLIVEGAR
ncbi:MAG: 16S rRNA (cytidine(1402)-2'-O)-methyltransferase [Bacteroidetes bacterium]|nr:MAG: 16S rRNA (cytidine(1402)-2'-O)-methyltransferase [Bacteroidota bacterium]